MTYDFHGAWEHETGFNAPLYKRQSETGKAATLNADWAIADWLAKGCPKHKLVMGLATYGRSFTLQNPLKSGVGAPARGAGKRGPFTGVDGFLGYYEICKLAQAGWTVKHDEEQVTEVMCTKYNYDSRVNFYFSSQTFDLFSLALRIQFKT